MTATDNLTSTMETAVRAVNTVLAEVDTVVATKSSTWLGWFGRVVLFILQLLSSIVYWSLKLTTVSVSALIYQLFSSNLTVTMNFTTL